MESKSWCSLPWQGIIIQPWGKVQMCCYTDNVSADTIGSYLQSTELKEIKKQMIAGERPSACSVCWKTEAQNKQSWRQKKNIQLQDQINLADAQNIDYQSIDYIELYISNKCNSKCRMCKPKWSTYWFSDYKDPVIKSIFNYSKEIEDTVVKYNSLSKDVLDELIHIINAKSNYTTISLRGGEPCYAEETFYLLENIKNKNKVKLDLTTNGTIVNNELIHLLNQFHSVYLGVSIDGSDKLNRYIRGNKTPLDKILENTKVFLNIKNISNFFISNTIMIYNIFDNAQLKESIKDKLEFLPEFDDKFLFNPMHLKCSILPNFLSDNVDTLFIKKFIQQENDKTELLKKWLIYTKQLDKLRNESLLDIEPRFSVLYEYIESKND